MKFFLTYLGLVGVPLLVLLGVLRMGNRITPPISIGGLWRVQSDGDGETRLDRFLAHEESAFEVAQSGARFEVRAGADARAGRGSVRDDALEAEHRAPTGEVDWRFRARRTGPNLIAGEWTFVGTSTRTVGFTATREGAQGRVKEGH